MIKAEIKAWAGLVLSGLLLTAAFPKTSFDGLAWLALLPLLWSLNGTTPKEAFRRGFIFGIAHFCSLLYWLIPTMVIYGHLPLPLSVGILFLFACVLSAVFVAPMTCGFVTAGRTPLRALLLFPVMWVGFEYLRAFLFTGFPWALLGYSQIPRLQLIQLSDIVGVYGVSALIAAANAALFFGALALLRRDWQGALVTGRLAIAGVAVAAGLVALAWGYGGWRIATIDRLAATAPTVRVAIIQGNIEQSQKWDPAFQAATIEKYVDLSLSTRDREPELIVWPESAAPFYLLREVPPTRMLLEGIAAANTYFLIGAPAYEPQGPGVAYYNRAYLIGPGGRVLGHYDKAHLVPFGEYTPFKDYLPFLGKIVEHVGDFAAGPKGRVLDWRDIKLGVQICYEIIFPQHSRLLAQNGARLLITITNDAWYGTTAGPHQHFSLAKLRAVENRRALVRAANTGISGFIDPVGRELDPTDLMAEAAVARPLPLLDAETLYTRCGDLFAAGCLALSIVGVGSGWRSARRSRPAPGRS
ncbi:MAG: apolipoprotein N-acyltransferase [Desulfobacterales bacterium]|jgi:apolipoprotein N-acyltransferase|nr:apolipoprotein N-acyltransferase [Desulfobacterales bacterium]